MDMWRILLDGWNIIILLIIMNIEIGFKCQSSPSYWTKLDKSGYLVSFVILNFE
jgi:hypothetical protein